MKLELLIRWAEKIQDPDKIEEIKARRIITGDEDDMNAESTTYSYDYIVLDTKDIKSFHRLDEEHFILKTYSEDAYCVKLPYEAFKDAYTQLTRKTITELRANVIGEDEDIEDEDELDL